MKTSWFRTIAGVAVAAVTFGFATSAQADTVSYRYPVYKTEGDPTSGIKEWKTGQADATPVDGVAWGTTGQTTWYVVNADKTYSSRITCSGDVHLILADDKTLKASMGITVVSGTATLTIYGQELGTGALNAQPSTTGREGYAGIGGSNTSANSGPITIHGGVVTAKGGKYAAGIGGGYKSAASTGGQGNNITINGGTVTATGGTNGAGIGGSYKKAGSNITLNGGTVTATGGSNANGIGNGKSASSSTGIRVAGVVKVLAGDSTPPTTEIAHDDMEDISSKEAFPQRYVTAAEQQGFAITVESSEHGSVSSDLTQAKRFQTVTLTATPAEGYALSEIRAYKTGEEATEVPVTPVEVGKTYTFEMPGYPVTVTATFCATAPIPSAPTAVERTTYKVYTNGVFSVDGTVWSNLLATVVYTAADGCYFADGTTVSTNRLDTTVNPAVNQTVPGAPIKGGPIMVVQSPGGTVSTDRTLAEEGQLITLTITPDSGYAYASENIKVFKTGDETTVVEVKNNAFVMPAYPVTVTVTFSTGVGYRYAVYNDPADPASGIAEWKSGVQTNATAVTAQTTWGETGKETWYVVNADKSIGELRITCAGDVHLILADGKTLTAWQGITVSEGVATLTIYGQELGTGALNAQPDPSSREYEAGIGGSIDSIKSGPITIHGGVVTANGGRLAAGIGGGRDPASHSGGPGNDITINGGTVTATSGTNAAGIGGACDGNGQYITINGGNVTAVGSQRGESTLATGAGIGGGVRASGSNITINGGTVTATGEADGAGIGGSKHSDGHDITINGGTVTATSGINAAGIGGGYLGNGQDITINGGNVTATGADGAAGIGGGDGGIGSYITIDGGTVFVYAPSVAADCIGSGRGSSTPASGVVIDSSAKVFFNLADTTMPESFEGFTINTPETAVARTLVGGIASWSAAQTFSLTNASSGATGAITVNDTTGVKFANKLLKLSHADSTLKLTAEDPPAFVPVEVRPVPAANTSVGGVYTNSVAVEKIGGKYAVATNAAVDVVFQGNAGYFFEDGGTYTSVSTQHVAQASSDPTVVNGPAAAVHGVKCGDTAYALVGGGKMTIVGTGAASSWPEGIARKSVTSVVINPGITGIGEAFFRGCTKLKKVTGGRDLATVGKAAFTKCFSLVTISLDCKKPQGLEDAVVYQTAINPDGSTYQIPSISVKDYVNRLFGSKSVENPEWVDLGSPENKSMYETEYNFFQIRMVPVEEGSRE